MKKIVYTCIAVIILAMVVMVCYATPKNYSNVVFQDLKIDEVQCYPFWFSAELFFQKNSGLPLLPQELVINTQEEYEKLLIYRRNTCNTPLPSVDFAQSTVIGKYAVGSCASYGFNQEVIRDDSNLSLKYSVVPKEHRFMSCSGPGKHSMNLIVVPKVPSDYIISFEPKADSKDDYRDLSSDPDNPGGWIERDYDGNVTRKGTGRATSTGNIQFEGFDPCITQEVYDLMIKSGGNFLTPPEMCPGE